MDHVEEASDRFYEALNRTCNGDATTMADAWWTDAEVTSGHPMGTWVKGWDTVWETWVEFSKVLSHATIRLTGRNVRVLGDTAIVTGTENVTVTMNGKPFAWTAQVTNVFHRRDGVWKLIHHHSDRTPAFDGAA